MSGAYKFGHLSASGDEEPFRYTDCYAVEKTTGPSRLVIAPAAGHVKLMRELTIAMRQPLGLLYVLVVPRGEGEAGRYQSPAPVSSDELQAFLSQFGEFLEKDARHHLWIMSTDSSSILVYDNHNVIYAYGPLDAFERILLAQGLARAENVVFPVPHMHRYNVEFDEQAKSLLSYWNWIHFPLQESDDR